MLRWTLITIVGVLAVALPVGCAAASVAGPPAALHVDRAPIAAPAGDVVCTASGATVRQRTALLLSLPVLHAGPCGFCSNRRDIAVYQRTRHTLTADVTACAFRHLLVGDDDSRQCLQDLGFTAACARCWQDNIACTSTNCRAVCLRSRLTGATNAAVADDGAVTLDPCIACDERACGVAFAACAGANRRRAGIVSDIARPPDQVWQGTTP